MFNSSAPSIADIAAVTGGGNNGWGNNGDGWWVLIILFALFGGWGRGGVLRQRRRRLRRCLHHGRGYPARLRQPGRHEQAEWHRAGSLTAGLFRSPAVRQYFQRPLPARVSDPAGRHSGPDRSDAVRQRSPGSACRLLLREPCCDRSGFVTT